LNKEDYYKEQLSSLKDVMRRTTAYMDELHDELERTKSKLELEHSEMTQSISYATKLQNKILLDESLFEAHFSESFMYLNQRDGIGGDMIYGKQKGDVIYFGLMDCTGHGIPGALISIMGYTFLEEILSSNNFLSPIEVCSQLDRKIRNLLKGNNRTDILKDGMDAIFCSYDISSKKLSYTCAGRPIWYCANGGWKKVKSERRSIGGDTRSDFVNEEVLLNEGDEIFLFSDGLTDQFGGENDKKFLPKRVSKIIKDRNLLSLETRLSQLKNEHLDWKSETFQTDDVAFLGLKI
jgi:serine phosphatase RsbU (regulator of sigma subunit)